MLQVCFLCEIILLIVLVIINNRVLLKPTFWVAGIILLSLSGAAVMMPTQYEFTHLNESIVRFTILIYPLFLMLWAILTPYHISFESDNEHFINLKSNRFLSKLLIVFSILYLVIAYWSLLTVVPIQETGLYALFFDPDNALAYRENTFKLLPNPYVKRLLSHANNVFIPLSFGLCFILFRRTKSLSRSIGYICILFLLLLVAGVNGSRSSVGLLLLFAGIIYLIEVGLLRGLSVLLFLVIVALVIAFLFTVMRRGELGVADTDRLLTFAYRIFRRAFLVPFETGLWHNEYVAINGSWGLSALGFPFKGHLGIDTVEYYRIVGAWYNEILGIEISTTNMNTSFIFSQQAIWGFGAGTIISFLLLIFADVFALISRKLPTEFQTIALAYVLWKLMSLRSTDIIGVYFNIVEFFLVLFGMALLFSIIKYVLLNKTH